RVYRRPGDGAIHSEPALPGRKGTGLAQQRDVLREPAPAWRFSRGERGLPTRQAHANDGLPGMINGSWETKYHHQKTNIHGATRPGGAKAVGQVWTSPIRAGPSPDRHG